VHTGAVEERAVDTQAAGAHPSTVLRRSRSARRRLVAIGAAAVFALIVAPIPTLTWQASLVAIAVGVCVVFLVVTGRPVRADPAKPVGGRGAIPWIVLIVVFTVLELSALLTGSRPGFPTLSGLIGPMFLDTTTRLVGYVAWLGTGYWLLRR